MRALALVLVGLVARAEVPDGGTDAPTVVVLDAGSVVPFDAVCMTQAQAVAVANNVKAPGGVSVPVVVAVALICVAGGVALGYAVRNHR